MLVPSIYPSQTVRSSEAVLFVQAVGALEMDFAIRVQGLEPQFSAPPLGFGVCNFNSRVRTSGLLRVYAAKFRADLAYPRGFGIRTKTKTKKYKFFLK